MRWIASLLALTLLLAALPLASGHAAPAPAAYETRLLHDHNDDSIFLTGEHGFDTIALDAREAHLADGTPALVLKLILNRGCDDTSPDPCGDLSLDVQFNAGGAARSVLFTTADGGATWTGDAVRYSDPIDLNDGTRFAVEGWIPMDAYGLAPGVEATDWFVAADNMPEGAVPGYPDPLMEAFDIGTYAVKAPDFYLNMTLSDVDAIEAGQSAAPVVAVENLLNVPQRVTIRVDGVNASSIDLAGLASGNVTLDLAPEESRNYTLTAASSLGGYERSVLPVKVHKPMHGGSDGGHGDEGHGDEDHGDGHGGHGAALIVSHDVLEGDEYRLVLNETGSFNYHNHHDKKVVGVVHVHEADGSPETHTIRYDGAFDPAELDAKVGDTVVWINDVPETLQVMGAFGEHEHDHDHGTDTDGTVDEEAPAIGLVALGLGLVALAVVARRT